MKVGIFYFSGTGNTRFIATKMRDTLIENNHQVDMFSIEDQTLIDEYDLMIIGGPIYAGNMPEMLIRWVIKNIPNNHGGKAIVFSTSVGLDNANGTASIGNKLQKKGYEVYGEFKYLLPRNFYLSGYEMTPDNEIHELFEVAGKKVIVDFNELSDSSKTSFSKKTTGLDLAAELMSIITRFMGKNYSVTKDCTKCKKCQNGCPTHNIQVNDEVRFGFKCMMCTRCIHRCPVNAITYKGKTFQQYKEFDIDHVEKTSQHFPNKVID